MGEVKSKHEVMVTQKLQLWQWQKQKWEMVKKKIAIINSDTAFIWIHIFLEVHENSILLRLSLNFNTSRKLVASRIRLIPGTKISFFVLQ